MTTLNIALVGLGNMGQKHYKTLLTMDKIKVVGLVDPRGFNSFYPVYENVEELLKNQHVDCAIIATPTKTHFSIARKFIQAGIHLLVEKPIAFNTTEGVSLLAAAKENNCKMAVGHIERFNPAIQALIKDLKSQETIIGCSTTRIGPSPSADVGDTGVLLDLGIHDIDLIKFITNKEIVDATTVHTGEPSSTAMTLLKLDGDGDDIPASIFTSYDSPFRKRQIKLITRGTCTTCYEVDLMNHIVIKNTDLRGHSNSGWRKEYLYVNKIDALKKQLQTFINYVLCTQWREGGFSISGRCAYSVKNNRG